MAKSLHRLAFHLVHAARKSKALTFFDSIAESPFLPADIAAERQLVRLRTLLSYAHENVAYYRELFDDRAFRAEKILSVSDMQALPILSKEQLRAESERLVSRQVGLLKYRSSSGGSTGRPVTFYRDREYLDWSDAGTYRNLSACGWTPGEMILFVWGFSESVRRIHPASFSLRQWARRSYQVDPYAATDLDLDRWLRIVERHKPAAILGYASAIARFARHATMREAVIPSLKGVFTTAEQLLPQHREDIRRAFRVPVMNLYGSSEVQNIAAECPSGGMHVNNDFVVLEQTAESELVLTSLHNRATPFIRYRNEDVGRLLDDVRCSCGRTFPLMDLQIGRITDSFVISEGYILHGAFFTALMFNSIGIDTFQWHQRSDRSIILRVVAISGMEREARESALSSVAEFRRLIPSSLSVEVEVVDFIERTASGKHRFTRSDAERSTP